MGQTPAKALATQPYRTVMIPLDTATRGYTMNKSGIHIWLLQASNANVSLSVAIGQADAETQPWRQGQGVRHWPYDRVWLSWPAQPGQWVEMAVAGELADWRPELFEVIAPIPAGNTLITNTAGQAVPVSLQSNAAGNVTVDLAAQSGGPLAIGGTVATAAGEWSITADTVYASHAANGNTLTTIYTVPAGKELVVRKSFAAMYFRAGSTYPASAYVSITDASDVEKLRFTFGTNQQAGFIDGLVLPTGWKIKAATSHGSDLIAYVTIAGATR